MKDKEYEELMEMLQAAVFEGKDLVPFGEEDLCDRVQEVFWKFPLNKRKQLLGAMVWGLIKMNAKQQWAFLKRSGGGSNTPYEAIHEEARKLYATSEYTTWGAANTALKLAKMNPGEFNPLLPKDANGMVKFPTVDAVNKALKKWLE